MLKRRGQSGHLEHSRLVLHVLAPLREHARRTRLLHRVLTRFRILTWLGCLNFYASRVGLLLVRLERLACFIERELLLA